MRPVNGTVRMWCGCCPPRDPAAWAAALQQILDYPERLRAMTAVVPESLPTVYELPLV